MTRRHLTRQLVTFAVLALASCGGDDPPASALCGDGVTTGSEACDDGNATDTDACTSRCVAARCGDGFVFAGTEACDDGDNDDGDGCSATCTIEVALACGNGAIEMGEQCDFADARCAACAYTGACAACETAATACLDSTGAELQTQCFQGTGMAGAGPAAGTSRAVLCARVIQCARQHGCAADAAETCWCGDGVGPNECIQGAAAGPCKAEVEAAAETTDGMVIASRFVDPGYGLGRAVRLLRCDQEACQDVCFP